ncbi:hypothetical protein RGQ29_008535 [Quercus rubra]|uniref:RRM domain-containing protein n=1 Tax=Quercus rubra TaxID=3512 RepID=A0AAN7E0S2_QUERU|nr:hypothetical protein RGQ29_008535 [Quercus rubra]
MSYTREGRSVSPRDSVSPPGRRRRSRSRSLSRSRRSRSRSQDSVDASNPGNNLYVTGLSTRVTSSDLEKYFNKEGKAKRKRGRTPTPGRYHGLRDNRRGAGQGRRRSRSYSPRRWQDRDPYSRDRRGRSRSPYGRRTDDYDSHRRRRERSLSAGGSGYTR